VVVFFKRRIVIVLIPVLLSRLLPAHVLIFKELIDFMSQDQMNRCHNGLEGVIQNPFVE